MRKAATIIIPALLLCLLAAQFSACERYVLPSLEVSADTLWFPAVGPAQTLLVKTNVVTVAKREDDDHWYDTDPAWFDADCEVKVYVLDNTDTSPREAILPVKSEALQRNVVIIQEGAVPDPD